MDKPEQKTTQSGESKIKAGQLTAGKEDLSFAKMLERFYLMNNVPTVEDDPAKGHHLVSRFF